jgi:glycosyltransferase involved in cell wall biosynthesis
MPHVADITVIVGTFGDETVWGPLAEQAMRSAARQELPPLEIIHEHATTLARARNGGAARARGRWLVFLDADDELDEAYIAAMEASLLRTPDDMVMRQPMTIGFYEDGTEDAAPAFIEPGRGKAHGAPLLERNHLVIGTAISEHLFHIAGGFGEWAVAEDWAAWLAAWCEGGTWQRVAGAIYRVGVHPRSRNRQPAAQQGVVIGRIRAKYQALARQRGLIPA